MTSVRAGCKGRRLSIFGARTDAGFGAATASGLLILAVALHRNLPRTASTARPLAPPAYPPGRPATEPP